MGGHSHDMPYKWQLPWLDVEQPWLALARPFLTIVAQMGTETTPLPLYMGMHHFCICRQFSVRRNICLSKSSA